MIEGKRKLISTGGAIAGIVGIASMVASGGLVVPIGLAFAGLVTGIAALHVWKQARIDTAKVGERSHGVLGYVPRLDAAKAGGQSHRVPWDKGKNFDNAVSGACADEPEEGGE